MVKGNWERRIELANKKRELAKEKKAAKKAPRTCTGEGAVRRLLAMPELASRVVLCYVAIEDARSVCSAFLRHDCGSKKCKHPHDGESLFDVAGVMVPKDDDDGTAVATEAAVTRTPLHALTTKDHGRVQFVSLDGACIFDYRHAECWQVFMDGILAQRKGLDRSDGLQRVKDVDDEDNGERDGQKTADLALHRRLNRAM